jgi:hypothetical protein
MRQAAAPVSQVASEAPQYLEVAVEVPEGVVVQLALLRTLQFLEGLEEVQVQQVVLGQMAAMVWGFHQRIIDTAVGLLIPAEGGYQGHTQTTTGPVPVEVVAEHHRVPGTLGLCLV